MDTETVQVFTSLLALVALAGAAATVVARVLAGRSEAVAGAYRAVASVGNWLAFVVAAAATAGSLYFSESAGYVPCTLCWYQRIAMYPLVLLTLVAAIRRDRAAVWYTVPVAAVGAVIAAYHYLIEWRPALDAGACSAVGPRCTDIWFREFGFVTLAFMALAGFVSIIVFAIAAHGHLRDAPPADDHRDLPPRTETP